MTDKSPPLVLRSSLTGLRIPDLVAKVAKVTLKDTVRVMMAVDLVVDFLGCDADSLLGQDFFTTKPDGTDAAMCSKAYEELRVFLKAEGDGDWLDVIKAVD